MAEEADSTFALGPREKGIDVGLASEADLARLLLQAGQIPIEQASEDDLSMHIGAPRSYPVGLVSETDSAQTVVVPPTDEDAAVNAVTGFYSTPVGVANSTAGVVTAMSDVSDSTYVPGVYGSGSYGSGTTDLFVAGVGFADLAISAPVTSFSILFRFSSTTPTHTALLVQFQNIVLLGGPTYTVVPAAGSGIQDLTLGPFTKPGGLNFTPAEINALTLIISNSSGSGSYVNRLYRIRLHAVHTYSEAVPAEALFPDASTAFVDHTAPGGVFAHVVLADALDTSYIISAISGGGVDSYGGPIPTFSTAASWSGSLTNPALAAGRGITKIRIVVRASDNAGGNLVITPTISGVTLATISGENSASFALNGSASTRIKVYEKSGGGNLSAAEVSSLTLAISAGSAGSGSFTRQLFGVYVVAVYA